MDCSCLARLEMVSTRVPVESYMYFPGKEKRCGDSWPWNVDAGDAKHEVKVYVKMNDPGVLPNALPPIGAR